MSTLGYTTYKDSDAEWIGQVPEHWSLKRLRFVANIRNSNVDKKSYEGQREVVLCNYTDVYYNERITDDIDFMTATASDPQIRAHTLKAGDVIITKDSEGPDDIGIPAYVTEDLPGVVCGYHLTQLSPHSVLGEYLFRVMQLPATKAHFFVEVSGVTRFGLGQDAIGNVPVPIPPVSEQRTICSWINDQTSLIDTLISEKAQFIKLMREKRQAVIYRAITKGLDPNVQMKDAGISWVGEVPEKWDIWKLSHAFKQIGSGTTPKSGDADYYENGCVPWLNTGDLNDGELFDCEKRVTEVALEAHSALRVYPAGSLAIAMYGATIGKLAMLRFPVTVNQACCVFAGEVQILSKFLFYWFLGMRRHIVSLAIGGGQPNINQEILRSLRVACPSKEEQLEIALFLDRETNKIDALITEAERAIELLKERRSALISAAVTGKIDVRGLVEEVSV